VQGETAPSVYPALHNKVLRLRNALWARTGSRRAFAPSSVRIAMRPPEGHQPVLGEGQLAELLAEVPTGAILHLNPWNAQYRRRCEAVLIAAERSGVQVLVDVTGPDLEQAAPVLYGLGASVVRFDLHGPEQVQNDALGIPDAFERTARGALMLKGLSNGTPHPRLTVQVPVSRANQQLLENTVECALAMGADDVVLLHALATGNGAADVVGEIDPSVLSAGIAGVLARWRKGRISVFPGLTEKEVTALYSEGGDTVGPMRCLAPWRSAAVDLEGNVSLCGENIGRWPRDTLLHIYNGQQARTFRKTVRKAPGVCCRTCSGRFGGEMLP
jgi:MoaA/NifB/PqqE/SkfB family radical SAM enzyme